jgi:hypothetical protein
MKKQILLYCAVLLFWNFGCQSGGGDVATTDNNWDTYQTQSIAPPDEANAKQVNQTEEQPQNSEVPTQTERKLIRNARVGFQTDDLEKSHSNVLTLTKKHKGYIANDGSTNDFGQVRHSITARIPAQNFDAFLEELGKDVEVFDYREVTAQDVTEEYLDVTARLKTKRALETRYTEILQKASSVTEILEVERQLSSVREEIESAEGRLKYLQNQVSFSTFSIEFYKEVPHKGTSFGSRLGKGFAGGWQNLLDFIIGLIHLWPFLFLIVGGVAAWRRIRKGGKKGV